MKNDSHFSLFPSLYCNNSPLSFAPFAVLAVIVLNAALIATADAQSSRDYVYVVASSTVYPFATIVAERFGRSSDFKTPKVESTEAASCAAIGVTEIFEVKNGYDGIVFAHSIDAQGVQLSRTDIRYL